MCWLEAVLSWASSWSLQITTAASRYIYIYPGISEYLLSPATAKSQQLLILKLLFWCTSQSDTNICKIAPYFVSTVSTPSNILVSYLDKTFYCVGLETLKLEGAKNRIKCPKTIQLILWLWQIVWSIVRSYGFKKSFFLVSFSGYRYYSDEDWGSRSSLSNTSRLWTKGPL